MTQPAAATHSALRIYRNYLCRHSIGRELQLGPALARLESAPSTHRLIEGT